jgi:hypothetical protein
MKKTCDLRLSGRWGSAGVVLAYGAWQVYLGVLVHAVVRFHADHTDCSFAFAAKNLGDVPSSMLYDDAFAGLLGSVLGNTLLQCVDVVREGDGWWGVLEILAFNV